MGLAARLLPHFPWSSFSQGKSFTDDLLRFPLGEGSGSISGPILFDCFSGARSELAHHVSKVVPCQGPHPSHFVEGSFSYICRTRQYVRCLIRIGDENGESVLSMSTLFKHITRDKYG